MATRISQAAAKGAVDNLTARLNSGTINIYSGAQPASVATAASGTLLATLTLSATAFGAATTASPSVATANAITSDTAADATGTAGWFRAFGTGAVAVIDGNVTATAGGGDMTLDSTSIVAGGTVAVTSWTVSLGTGA